ncbi:hypothetical protein Esti_001325 [Eimeria stiedai]
MKLPDTSTYVGMRLWLGYRASRAEVDRPPGGAGERGEPRHKVRGDREVAAGASGLEDVGGFDRAGGAGVDDNLPAGAVNAGPSARARRGEPKGRAPGGVMVVGYSWG